MESLSVLLVDDNAFFLKVASRFLQESYHEELRVVGTAASGEEALEQARTLQPEVILLDLSMPGISGLEAIPLLRQIVPEANIVVLTLQDASSYRQAALMAGANNFVCKTALDTDLISAIFSLAKVR